MYDCLWIYIPAKLRMKMCIFPIYIYSMQNDNVDALCDDIYNYNWIEMTHNEEQK